MTYKEIYCFLSDDNRESKPEHTTRFISRYQQTSSGNGTYLHKAIEDGVMIYKLEGEPNQKWHFNYSWYKCKTNDNPGFKDEKVRSWCSLRCPELLLWIAEVCGQQDKVKEVVDEILSNDNIYANNDFIARNKMVSLIKNKIQWSDIEKFIDNNRA